MAPAEEIITAIQRGAEESEEWFRASLRTLVEHPSISPGGQRPEAVSDAVAAAAEIVRETGGQAELIETGGTPALVGQYPNLRDDAWLWGGSVEQIQHTIVHGRQGYMPPFGEVLSEEQIDQLAHYVLSLSNHQNVEVAKMDAGRALFQGQEGGCHYCHTESGKGMYSQGAANLTDAVWTVADVNGAADLQSKLKAVRNVISNGIARHMPAWQGRLSESEIKLLTVYVHGLGGGQ